ncbi:hypothetical protein ABT354_35990 [Streptomyces sp. NPDC000594]|uniref:hypothetical protein n=1 Tax=Streptomyces sp. NPDC000594 TaxID=3154261 RepID=UPI003326295B
MRQGPTVDDDPHRGDGAGTERLLRLVAEHHDSVRAALDEDQFALLLLRLRGLTDAPPDDDRAVRRALQGVRLVLLPLPLGHPVRAALDSVRLVAPPPGASAVADARMLMARLTEPSPPTRPPAPDGGGAAAREQLLSAPALTLEEVRARCGTPPPN